MLKRIARAIDLIFVFSERARQAQMASRVSDIPMELMYDRGLDVLADDMRPEFKEGRPPSISTTRYIVGKTDAHGAMTQYPAMAYDASIDAWISAKNGFQKKREDDDLWLSEEDHRTAFINACRRAENRRTSFAN